jgi:hypothetical protein
MAITICSSLSHPTKLLSRIVCRGQEGPKTKNALDGQIFRPILDLCNFFQSQCHHNKQEGGCKESRFKTILS